MSTKFGVLLIKCFICWHLNLVDSKIFTNDHFLKLGFVTLKFRHLADPRNPTNIYGSTVPDKISSLLLASTNYSSQRRL